jgi:peroxiredoxin
MRLALGAAAPDFSLPDPDGKTHSLSEFSGKPALLVAFFCNHCPYVKHVAPAFAQLAKEYQGKGAAVVAINSNDFKSYTDDSPAKMKTEIADRGYTFPYLVDESQAVAQAYHAACTPDFFVFDKGGKLAYRGQMDGSRPGNNEPVTGKDLRDALDAVLAGRPAAKEQRPSMGCNIKWKPGNEPR